MNKYYPVSSPSLNGNEKTYVLDCLNSTWISSKGKYIEKFEEQLAQFCNTKHAIVCSSGTTALHLALLAHGVGPGDEVIVPTLTFVATANAVTYCGAKPVFVDIEPDTWNIDPNIISSYITSRTKGIIAVHLYGHPANMEPLYEIAQSHGLFVMEDAAEAIGAQFKGRMIGSVGDTGIFSFFGNKIITTGEGGAITTNDGAIATKIRLLREQGMDTQKRYWYPVIGYNYRMTNIQAAIGCAQLEQINWHMENRLRVAQLYFDTLKDREDLILPVERDWAKNVYWMFSVVLRDGTEHCRNELMRRLSEQGIETRPFFYAMHTLPPYKDFQSKDEFPIANHVATSGINLPTYAELTTEDIEFISQTLKSTLDTVG